MPSILQGQWATPAARARVVLRVPLDPAEVVGHEVEGHAAAWFSTFLEKAFVGRLMGHRRLRRRGRCFDHRPLVGTAALSAPRGKQPAHQAAPAREPQQWLPDITDRTRGIRNRTRAINRSPVRIESPSSTQPRVRFAPASPVA